MTKNNPLLICVVGATAIGKTALAVSLAKSFNTEIVSADSRQFYKEMTIGTAVPSSEELAAAPHHFIQNRSILKDYSVGDFERDAIETLDRLFEKNSKVIMVGGSGLYVDAVVKGLDSFPEVSVDIRDELNSELNDEGIENLQKELMQVDPEYYEKVDIYNPHRLIRALEIYRASGKPYSTFLNQEPANRSFRTVFIGIDADRQIIYDRINLRVDQMFDLGLMEEARGLLQYKKQNALQTVGYRELFQYFNGELTEKEAREEIKKNTRRFAKRQQTWFKKNTDINWFDYKTPSADIIDFINKKAS